MIDKSVQSIIDFLVFSGKYQIIVHFYIKIRLSFTVIIGRQLLFISQRLYYIAPKDSIEIVADRTYEHGMGTKPLLHSIERRKDDTKVTFLQPIYFDWQWMYYSPGFKIVDKKAVSPSFLPAGDS